MSQQTYNPLFISILEIIYSGVTALLTDPVTQYYSPSYSYGRLLLDPLSGGQHWQVVSVGAGGKQVKEDIDQITGEERLLRVLPGSHVGYHGGYLVLDVDARADSAGEVLEHSPDCVLTGHGGQDERGEEGEIG